MSSESSEMRRGSPLVEFLAEHPPGFRPITGRRDGGAGLLGARQPARNGTDEAFQAGVERVIGARAPIEPNTVSRVGEAAIAWLGPDEWLVISPPDIKDGLSAKLEEALAGLHASVNDISSGQTIIRLHGARARDLLSKGCPLDLHPRVFGVGQCAQSHIAKSNALIIQVDDTPTYDVIVRRSFADYLARWFSHAGREYDIAVVTG